jgi:hypothetical protein
MTPEQAAQEAIRKAAAIEEMTRSEGWKILIETVNSLIEKEIESLMKCNLNDDYYRKIGYDQSLHYITCIQDVVTDPIKRNFLLSQGRALGLKVLGNVPQYFFDGRLQGKTMLDKLNTETPSKQDFLNEQYSKS